MYCGIYKINELSLKLPNKITCRDLTGDSSGTLALTYPNAQCCDPEEHNEYLLSHENLNSNSETNFFPGKQCIFTLQTRAVFSTVVICIHWYEKLHKMMKCSLHIVIFCRPELLFPACLNHNSPTWAFITCMD